MIPFLVELLREADGLLRTGHDTELTSLTTFFIDRNLSHFSFPFKPEWDADERRFSGYFCF